MPIYSSLSPVSVTLTRFFLNTYRSNISGPLVYGLLCDASSPEDLIHSSNFFCGTKHLFECLAPIGIIIHELKQLGLPATNTSRKPQMYPGWSWLLPLARLNVVLMFDSANPSVEAWKAQILWHGDNVLTWGGEAWWLFFPFPLAAVACPRLQRGNSLRKEGIYRFFDGYLQVFGH